jgi:hypothetical protein
MNNHKVQFMPSSSELIKSLIDFWDEYKIEGSSISYIRDLRDKHSGINDLFWREFEEDRKDSMHNAKICLLFGKLAAEFKMKCFTEIRDNQKINPKHTGDFGKFGILMKDEWLLRNGGCPVVYVSDLMPLTNIIGQNMSIMQTLDNCTRLLAGVNSLAVHSAFFDLLSFFETSNHRYECEWRVVSGHSLGGRSFLPKFDRLKFCHSDVHSLFVPSEEAKSQTKAFIESIWPESDAIPKVFLTNEILLTQSEMREIEKIQARGA